MAEFDYYSIMEKRINYLSKKYDPFNKFSREWEKITEKQNCTQTIKPKLKKILAKQMAEIYNSVIAFLL